VPIALPPYRNLRPRVLCGAVGLWQTTDPEIPPAPRAKQSLSFCRVALVVAAAGRRENLSAEKTASNFRNAHTAGNHGVCASDAVTLPIRPWLTLARTPEVLTREGERVS
jgi:hypothetical protein